MADFGEITYHSGRKEHRCIWCGEIIPKGEVFAHYRGISENEWQNWRMHKECLEATDKDDVDLSDGFYEYEHKRGTSEPK